MSRSRLRAAIIASAIGLLIGGYLNFAIIYSMNLGPAGHIRCSTGRDVHRHDFVDMRGVPWPYDWQHDRHMYVYNGNKFVPGGPTDDERIEWIANASRLYHNPITIGPRTRRTQWEQKLEANPAGGMREYSRLVLLANMAIFAVIPPILWLTPGMLYRRIRGSLRSRRNCCQKCGYDLRGSLEFGRCPECGERFELPRW